MNVDMRSRRGNYNFIDPSQYQTEVWVRVDNRYMSETWADDMIAPDVDTMMPSEVVELIAERSKRWLYSSGRELLLANVTWVREHAEEVNDAWARALIDRYRHQIVDLEEKILRLNNCYVLEEDYNG
jgi:hypothetical protein